MSSVPKTLKMALEINFICFTSTENQKTEHSTKTLEHVGVQFSSLPGGADSWMNV